MDMKEVLEGDKTQGRLSSGQAVAAGVPVALLLALVIWFLISDDRGAILYDVALVALAANVFVLGIFLHRQFQAIRQHMNAKRRYRHSAFFEQTSIPFEVVRSDGKLRLSYVFHEATRTSHPSATLFVQALVPDPDMPGQSLYTDVIVLHKSGVYVVDFLPLHAFVYGKPNAKYWTLGFEKDAQKQTREIRNPLLMNQKRLNALESSLEIEGAQAVVVDGATRLRMKIANVHTIESFQEHLTNQPTVYSEGDMRDLYNRLDRMLTHNGG